MKKTYALYKSICYVISIPRSQYRGYYYLSQKIEEYLNDDEHALTWNELLDDYQFTEIIKGKLSIKPKGWR